MSLFIMGQIIKIYPTPVIGGVGLIKKLSKPIAHKFQKKKYYSDWKNIWTLRAKLFFKRKLFN